MCLRGRSCFRGGWFAVRLVFCRDFFFFFFFFVVVRFSAIVVCEMYIRVGKPGSKLGR